jgi:hypothetical protein
MQLLYAAQVVRTFIEMTAVACLLADQLALCAVKEEVVSCGMFCSDLHGVKEGASYTCCTKTV